MLRRPPTTIKLTPEDVLEHDDLTKKPQEADLTSQGLQYKKPLSEKTRLERIGI